MDFAFLGRKLNHLWPCDPQIVSSMHDNRICQRSGIERDPLVRRDRDINIQLERKDWLAQRRNCAGNDTCQFHEFLWRCKSHLLFFETFFDLLRIDFLRGAQHKQFKLLSHFQDDCFPSSGNIFAAGFRGILGSSRWLMVQLLLNGRRENRGAS